MSLLLIITTLLRSGVGSDYYSYYSMFNSISSDSLFETLSLNIRVEPGFRIWMQVFKSIGASPELFLNITSLIILIFFLLWIYNNSENINLSFILFYSLFYNVWVLSALRQGLALSIGSYLFLSKKKIDFSKSLVFALLLSSFHSSALFYIPIIIIRHMNITKKGINKFLVLTIIVSFLPLSMLLSYLDFLPFTAKLLSNLDTGLPFLNFSYQVRILMTIFGVILLYFREKTFYYTKMTTIFLIGFGFYFSISFSELIGSRMGIYTYILIVLLLPYFIENINKSNIKFLHRMRVLALVFTLAFATLSLYKEIDAMRIQSYFVSDEAIMPYITVLNPRHGDFGSREAFVLARQAEEATEFENYHEGKDYSTVVEFDSTIGNVIVEAPSKDERYLINSFGERSYSEKIVKNSTLYSDVIVSDWQMPLLKDVRYFDLTNSKRSKDELREKVVYETRENLIFQETSEELTSFKYDDLPEATQNLFKFKRRLGDLVVYKISKPFEYHVVVAEYQQMKHYLYLDENLEPLINRVFVGKSGYNSENIIALRYQTKDYFFNKKGELIWIQ